MSPKILVLNLQYTQTALSGSRVNSIYFSNCPAKTPALYRQHLGHFLVQFGCGGEGQGCEFYAYLLPPPPHLPKNWLLLVGLHIISACERPRSKEETKICPCYYSCWAGGGLLALISLTTKSDLHFHIQNFKLSQ